MPETNRDRMRHLADHIEMLQQEELSIADQRRMARLAEELQTLRVEYLEQDIATLRNQLPATVSLEETEDTEPVEARAQAETFLRDMLADHEVPADTIWAAAHDKGIAERTLKRVKSRLGVKTERRGYGPNGQWFWSLPKASPPEAGNVP